MVRSDGVIAATSISCASRPAPVGRGEIDLSADARAWPQAADEQITELVAGFCVGEAGVAEHLARVRRRRRRGVLRRPAARRGAPCAVLRPLRGGRRADRPARARAPRFLELFDERLPEAARGGARRGRRALPHGPGGRGLHRRPVRAARPRRRPAARAAEGIELVLRDERWHVGFGTRCLADLDVRRGRDPRRGRARRRAVGAGVRRARGGRAAQPLRAVRRQQAATL